MTNSSNEGNAIKAFIFDFGNVLSLPPNAEHMSGMANYLGAAPEDFERAYFQWRNNYDDGSYGQHDYWAAVASSLGKQITEKHSADLFDLDYKMWFREPNRVTVNWVKHLCDSGYKVALLSNMPGDHKEHLDLHCQWFPTFHHRTFSGVIKCAKPHPDIYHHCLKGLGVDAAETIFIDDNADNIKAARNLAINSIHFVDVTQVAAEIQSKHKIHLPLN